MKNFLTFLSIFLLFAIYYLLSAAGTHAQTMTFPIVELGNCNNAATCKIYCDQPQNHDACTLFAKEKGIAAGKRRVNEKHVSVLSSAKTALGCSTIAACQSFCEEQANWERCQVFAQKHGLSTSQKVSAKDEELLSEAKQNLNCDSFDSCEALCEQKANYTKCAALLQDQVTSDDRAMFEKYKPQIKEFLGCDSMVTCMAFCMNPLNMSKCSELGSKIGSSEQIPNQEPPEVWCPKVSSECKWDGANCVCNGPESCQRNPECRWDGLNCQCGDTPSTESPEVWCPKAGPGCSWDGKQCFCLGSESSTQTEGTQAPQEPGEVWCPKIGPYCVWDGTDCTCWDDCVKSGGTWTGSRCDFQQQTTSEPGEIWCPRNSGCSWTGSECQCTSQEVPQAGSQAPPPAVQGVSANRSLLQQILDFILRR